MLKPLLAATIAIAAVAWGHRLVAQQLPLPTFRSGIVAVQFDAVVTDAAGNPATDLTAEDFEILENGVRQPITAFSFVNIPIGPPLGPANGWPVQPDVLSNTGPEGRVYLIALDPVQPPELALRARAFLRRFLEEHFQPNDVAAVVLTGRGLVTSGQDFTSDPRRLLEAIDRWTGGALGASSRDTIRSLRDLTEVLARMPGGRKALIYITRDPGFDAFEIVDRRPSPLALRFGFEDAHHVIATATRHNISFYPVDPAGLSPDLDPIEMRMNMVALAEVTGGVALSHSNSFTAAFDRIVRENSTYYTLGFNSSYESDDGRYVRVDVRVKRPGLRVHTRGGYVAPGGREPRATVQGASAAVGALGNPVATRGAPLHVFAAAYRGTARDAAVALVVEIDRGALEFVEREGVRTGSVEVAYVATDARKRIYPGGRHSIALALTAEQYAHLSDKGLRLVSQLALPAGRYQLRVAAGSGTRAGSVVYDLDVPNFTSDGLMLSGIALTSAAALGTWTVRPDPAPESTRRSQRCEPPSCAAPLLEGAPSADDPLHDALPGPATTKREFSREDTVVVFAEVYENSRGAPPSTIQLITELRTPDGRSLPLTRTRLRVQSGVPPAATASPYSCR